MSSERYGVIGDPVGHSRSPFIHASFARQTGQALQYERIPATDQTFEATLDAFRLGGGRGVNVTLPFKERACGYARALSARAALAGAVNTLSFSPDGAAGENTDGVGLMQDLARLARDGAASVAGAHVVVLGAGGAARGVVGPLLDAQPASLTVVSRDARRGTALLGAIALHPAHHRAQTVPWKALGTLGADIVINATSAGVAGTPIDLPAILFRDLALAYDLSYGQGTSTSSTAFLEAAVAGGARHFSDGLGMLVEQAAESFFIWRGVRPEVLPVLQMLRSGADQ